MTGFEADWLALREQADARSRATSLPKLFAQSLPSQPKIADFGGGTGNNIRYLSSHVPEGVQWTLVEQDEALSAKAKEVHATVSGDLTDLELLERLIAEHDAVVCSALLDLVSEQWLTALSARLHAHQKPFFAVLTYDGRMRFQPSHAFDNVAKVAFNAHQRTDKGFGPALGPMACFTAVETMRKQGFKVWLEESDWRLQRDQDEALIQSTLDGITEALCDLPSDFSSEAGSLEMDSGSAQAWRAARRDTAEMVIGHGDLLALPG